MANLNVTEKVNSKAGVCKMIKHSLKIDMTPMVDLGFLLISFFVITAELSRPTAMNLIMPKDGPASDVGETGALTVLIDKNNSIYYYEGNWKDAKEKNKITATDFTGNGLRKIISAKQNRLDVVLKNKGGRNELMLMIKASPLASYKNIVDALDEATITVVKKYALLKLTKEEEVWLKENIK